MPGIVGLITKKSREWAERQLLQMVEALHHESFYATGVWIDESAGVYVGWIARQGSFCDGMPLRNENGEVVLVFSGEEFPEPRTIGRLKDAGHAVEADGPSYLVHWYEENPSFLADLNGRFHGLLTDRARGTTTLFNDRYSMQRLYYHEAKDAFYFAAEAKAILKVRPELRRANTRAMGEFVSVGCVLENRTLFEDIHVLPGASAWTFRDGSLERKGHYFEPREWEELSPLEPEAYYQELRNAFSGNLSRYFNCREPIAVSLTGGLDTRLIMAWWKAPPMSLPCYTFGGMFRDCQDVIVARKVASACGQSHGVIPVGEDFLRRFPEYAERTIYLTDGCVDVGRSADLYVNEKARKIAPMRMVGTYGSEIVSPAPGFKPVEPVPGLFRAEFLPQVRQAEATYAELRRQRPITFAAFRQSPWYHFGVLELEQTQVGVRSPYLDNDFVRTVYRSPRSVPPQKPQGDVRMRMIAEGNAVLGNMPTDRGLTREKGGLSNALFRGYLEFTFKAEYAYDYGMPQWVAQVDHVFSPLHLERLFLGRHKFYHFRVWYRDALSKYVRETLLDPRTLSRPYLERGMLENIVGRHLRGDRNYTTAIHRVMTLELVHRLFIDS